MNKKAYIQPRIKVRPVKAVTILAGSPVVGASNYSTGGQNSKEYDFDFDSGEY